MRYKIDKQHLALVLVIMVVSVAGYLFSVSDRLAGFSDDSATYIIMAMNISPLYDAEPDIIKSYHYHHLTPGLPVIIGLFDLQNSISSIHTLILLQLILALILLAAYSRITTGHRIFILPVLLFISLPGTWIELLKISSENQYIVLSLVTLMMIDRSRLASVKASNGYYILLGLLLSFTVLTRSIGIAMIAAVVVWMALNYKRSDITPSRLLLLAGFSLMPLVLWQSLKPDISHSYLSDLYRHLLAGNPVDTLTTIISSNIIAIHDAWFSNLMLYSGQYSTIWYWLAVVTALFALAGFITRLSQPDALYLLFYLAILLIWPYPAEMSRFLYPVLPLAGIYVFCGIKWITERLHANRVITGALVIMMFITPVYSLKHVIDRHDIGKSYLNTDISHIPELYSYRDLTEAISTAFLWNRALELMREMRGTNIQYGLTLTIKPQVLTLLSGIYAERIPIHKAGHEQDYIEYIKKQNARHVLLTTVAVSEDSDNSEVSGLLDKIASRSFSLDLEQQGKKSSVVTMFTIDEHAHR